MKKKQYHVMKNSEEYIILQDYITTFEKQLKADVENNKLSYETMNRIKKILWHACYKANPNPQYVDCFTI